MPHQRLNLRLPNFLACGIFQNLSNAILLIYVYMCVHVWINTKGNKIVNKRKKEAKMHNILIQSVTESHHQWKNRNGNFTSRSRMVWNCFSHFTTLLLQRILQWGRVLEACVLYWPTSSQSGVHMITGKGFAHYDHLSSLILVIKGPVCRI